MKKKTYERGQAGRETDLEKVKRPIEKEPPLETVEKVEEGAEIQEENNEQIETLKEEAESLASPEQTATPDPEDVKTYITKHLPNHLKSPSVVSTIYSKISELGLSILERLGKITVEGKEHIPAEGPCVFIANHTRLFDESKIAALAGRRVHTVGADIHFDNFIKRTVMKLVGVIEVPGTLSKLSEEEKQKVVNRAPKGERAYYQKVIERDKEPLNRAELKKFLQTVTATLAKGEPVTLFPEGLWTFEGNVMREAYPGIEAVARAYKKLTGEDLRIVPIAITDTKIQVAEPTTIQKGKDVHDIMKEIAEMLPEEARGFYK